MTKKGSVYVGMSGGVDSSLSASLLKEQGYDVTGVFIRVWQPEFMDCSGKKDEEDARAVAEQIGIPFKTIDLVDEYKTHIIDYMITEYAAGRTPNPDTMCNRFIKFGGFFDAAQKNGINFIATGHYVRNQENKGESFDLMKGIDPNKDQSYFLWMIRQEALARALFPVGSLEKPVVREMARERGLLTAERKDSQGVCFVGKMDMKEFLSVYIAPKKGDVLNVEGEVIGNHDGAQFITIGQRHGFTITKKTPNDVPYYLVSKDVKNNTITVDTKKDNQLSKGAHRLVLHNLNWISRIPIQGTVYDCRVRYRQPLMKTSVESVSGTEAILTFDEDVHVALGQSAVLYEGNVCLGGGIVDSKL